MEQSSLKEILASKKMTQCDLGRAVGVSESQISLLLNGKRRMSLELAASIANSLKISIDDVFHILDFANRKDKTTA